MKKYTQKQCKKLLMKKCFFCGCGDYALLDTHRIEQGGKYTSWNELICCCACHRRIHSGQITVYGKHNSTGGVVVHFTMNGQEYWEKEFRWDK